MSSSSGETDITLVMRLPNGDTEDIDSHYFETVLDTKLNKSSEDNTLPLSRHHIFANGVELDDTVVIKHLVPSALLEYMVDDIDDEGNEQ